MKLNSRLLAAGTLIASLHVVPAADITGKITLKGTPPPEQPIVMSDPNCGKGRAAGEKPTTHFYEVGPGAELADVFVYIKEGAPKGAAPAEPGMLDQKGCEYHPYISGLQTGQKLVVSNSDEVLHNIHATPTVPGNKEKNVAQMSKGKPLEFVFDNPEVLLRMKCDVHPWMFAYVGVVDHPYFAVTKKDGTFKIANVPPGTYTIEAYHRKAGKMTQKVTVEKDSKTADFTLEVKPAGQ